MRWFRLILGMLWASPITFVCFFFYIMPLWALGYYKFAGWDEVAWVWHFQTLGLTTFGFDGFMSRAWKQWSGHAFGNLVVMKVSGDLRYNESFPRMLKHEKEHVVQVMRLGVFQLILYAVNYIVGRWILRNADGYYDNIFEIDARRAAGQLIDVQGVLEKLKKR